MHMYVYIGHKHKLAIHDRTCTINGSYSTCTVKHSIYNLHVHVHVSQLTYQKQMRGLVD